MPNNKTQIKICGITRIEDAKLAVSLGVNALGFNFFRQSSRYVSPEQAEAIVRALPEIVWRVGVFVNTKLEDIENIASRVGLDTIQLHSSETPELISKCRKKYRVIKALRLSGTESEDELFALAARVDYLLLDKRESGVFGGTGREISKDILMKFPDSILHKSFLAGGIRPENVSEKIRIYKPFGIDTASGVEESPGKKSAEKMRALVVAVK